MDVQSDNKPPEIPKAEAPVPGAEADLEWLQPDQARLDRIAEYQAEVLGLQDPLLATLGSLNSDQMQIALTLAARVEQALSNTAESAGQIGDILPLLNIHLKYTRQIEQFARLGKSVGRAVMNTRSAVTESANELLGKSEESAS